MQDLDPRPARTTGPGPRSPLAGRLSLEVVIYAAILVLALITRFYDLGSRPLHHDESLHALFSWRYYSGQGYVHNPMMHGPWQFHVKALMFFLFGAGDYVARVAEASFGVAMVMMPVLLRRYMGRWGALAASFLLLVSPSFLYFSRFARADIFAVTWTMILFISIVLFMDRPKARYLYTGAASLALLFATKEVSFIVAFIFGTFLLFAVLWQASRAAMASTLAYGTAALLVVMTLPTIAGFPGMPEIPLENPSAGNIVGFLAQTLVHPLMIALLALTLASGVVIGTLLARRRSRLRWLADAGQGEGGWSPIRSVVGLFREPWRLAVAALIFVGISVVLFTSVFSNMAGLGSSFIGSLGYWLAQHGVERGKQPWFYYLFLIPLYEPLTLIVALGGGIIAGVQQIARRAGGQVKQAADGLAGNAMPMAVFLGYWAAAGFVIYSWAGEKMPWLLVHMVLPITLLAALLIGRALDGLPALLRAASGASDEPGLAALKTHGLWILTAALVVVGLWLFLSLNQASLAGGVQWWALMAAPAAGLVLIIAASLAVPLRLAAWGAFAALLILGVAFHVHSAWNFSYYNGATPVEMGVYVQTSPDVTRVMRNLDRLSTELTGGKDIRVVYDSTVSWPFEWYLRDYRNKRFMPNGPAEATDALVVLIGADHQAGSAPFLEGYEAQRYVLRWWFPEDTYRAFGPPSDSIQGKIFAESVREQLEAGGGALATLAEPAQRAKLWRLFVYRQPYGALGSTDFYLYVRSDLVPYWHALEM